MIEEEKFGEYTIEINPFGCIEQNITHKDRKGSIVMSHDTFMVDRYPII